MPLSPKPETVESNPQARGLQHLNRQPLVLTAAFGLVPLRLSSNKTVSSGGVEVLLQPSAVPSGAEGPAGDDAKSAVPEFVCRLTGQIMTDPVVASDGNTYERKVRSSDPLHVVA